MIFELQQEYIEMIKLLKIMGLAESGGDAKRMVEAGEVIYNNEVDYRKRLKVRKGDLVRVNGTQIEVV